MNFPLMSCDEIRALERRVIDEVGLPGLVLMENAGRGAAELLRSLGSPGPVVVCCGKGNNGGDGLVIARHLDLFGVPVRALLFADPESLSGDARVQYQVLSRLGFPVEVLPGAVDRAALDETLAAAAWVVDALYGTGLKGPVRPPHDAVIEAINAASAQVLAVDIPSGLDGDTGQPLGPTVQAEHTATFLACKRGLVLPGAQTWTGTLHVLPIGLPPRLLNLPAPGQARGEKPIIPRQ